MFAVDQNTEESFSSEAGDQNEEKSFLSEAGGSQCKTTDSRRLSLAVEFSHDATRKRVLTYTSKPTQKKMVLEAIKVIGITEEKGASVAAIAKWIIGNYAILDVDRIKMNIKKEILKQLEKGTIERAQTSKGARGANGSFILSRKRQGKSHSIGQKSKLTKSTPSNQKENSSA